VGAPSDREPRAGPLAMINVPDPGHDLARFCTTPDLRPLPRTCNPSGNHSKLTSESRKRVRSRAANRHCPRFLTVG